MERICQLCPGRTCVDTSTGRLINDNPPEVRTGDIDISKIKPSEVSIEDCAIRPGMECDDSKLLGS